MPSATVDHAARAAQGGFATVCNGPTERIAAIVARFRAEWTRPAPLPCIGLSRAMVIAETAAEAQAVARRAWRVHAVSFLKLWRKHGAAPVNAVMSEDFADAEAAGLAFAGTPAMVRDALRAQVAATGVNYVVSRFAFGDQDHARDAALRHAVRARGHARAGGGIPRSRLANTPREKNPMSFPLPESNPEALGLDPRPLERLCATIERHVAEGHQPGAQVAIARHGKLALFRSFGRPASRPMRRPTRAASS